MEWTAPPVDRSMSHHVVTARPASWTRASAWDSVRQQVLDAGCVLAVWLKILRHHNTAERQESGGTA